MNVLRYLRRRRCRAAAAGLLLTALASAAVAAPQCVMALDAADGAATAHHHDCPHCPPQPVAEATRDDCETPQALTPPRLEEPAKPLLLATAPAMPLAAGPEPVVHLPRRAAARAPSAPGPRPHLLHVQFNE